MKILFLQTGGTIDKDYPMGEDNHGYSFVIKSPAYERILTRVNPSFNYEMKVVLQKDSLDITYSDRNIIFEACRDTTSDKIIVTHGTDTMIQTAKVLSQIDNKTIVLTGAMSPELFKDSDADFNLGVAVGAVSVCTPGVYIAMNGRVFRWDEVTFDETTSKFAPVKTG